MGTFGNPDTGCISTKPWDLHPLVISEEWQKHWNKNRKTVVEEDLVIFTPNNALCTVNEVSICSAKCALWKSVKIFIITMVEHFFYFQQPTQYVNFRIFLRLLKFYVKSILVFLKLEKLSFLLFVAIKFRFRINGNIWLFPTWTFRIQWLHILDLLLKSAKIDFT